MSRFVGLVFAACLLAIWSSTTVPAANSDWPKSLTLGTASPGGVYYIYGDALAKILTEKLGIPVDPFPTQGTLHNVMLVDSGGIQLGLITMGVGLRAWTGTGDLTNGKQLRTMRALFPMYDTPFQAWTLRRSGIATLAQLDKKPIGGGPRAGTSGPYIPQILKALGIAPEINHGSWDDMLSELLAGRHDAFLAVIGAPMPAVEKAGAKEPLAFIDPSPEQIEAIRKALPEFSPSTVAAGTYRFLDKDHATFGVYNFAIGRADLPDDLVHDLIKAVFENQPRLLQAHPAASQTLPQNVDKNTFLPFHPGAVRYYREIGIKIPDELVPMN
jgi:uncharacterized protein